MILKNYKMSSQESLQEYNSIFEDDAENSRQVNVILNSCTLLTNEYPKLVCFVKFGVVDEAQWRETFPDDQNDLEKLSGKKRFTISQKCFINP